MVARISNSDLDGPRIACIKSLRYLCKEVLGMKDWGKIHDELEGFLNKPDLFKLAMLARGHLKSSIITKGWSIQQVLKNPDIRILIANAVWDNSRKFLRSIESYLITGGVMSQLFGKFESGHWNQDECTVLQRRQILDAPTWTTTGLERELTSQHFDLIILDDMVAKENTGTPEMREKVKEYYGMLYALLEPEGRMIVLGTRYHQDDLYSQILEDVKFDKFIRTAYTDDSQMEVIFPEKFTLEMLNEIRKDTRMGSYKFSAQYLNNPIDPSTADFRREWIQYYEPNTAQPASLYLSVDPAISLSRDADFSALVVCGQFENKRIRVVDYVRKKMVPSDLVDAIFALVEKWRLHRVGIETFAFQKTLKYEIQRKQRETGKFFSIDEIGRRRGASPEQETTKEAKIRRLQPYFEQGLIELAPWMQELVDELLSFPRGRFDDLVDALAMQLDYLVPSYASVQKKIIRPGTMGDLMQRIEQRLTGTDYEEFMKDLKQAA